MLGDVLDRNLSPELCCQLVAVHFWLIGGVFNLLRTSGALRMLLDMLALVDELVGAAAGKAALSRGAQLLRKARHGTCGS